MTQVTFIKNNNLKYDSPKANKKKRVLVMSSNTKVLKVIDELNILTHGWICRVDSLIGGLKILHDEQPDIVFVQDLFDGLPGESIAWHAKNFLNHHPPKVILLQNWALRRFKWVTGITC